MKMPRKIKMKQTIARAQVGVSKRVREGLEVDPPPPSVVIFCDKTKGIYLLVKQKLIQDLNFMGSEFYNNDFICYIYWRLLAEALSCCKDT